MNYFGARKFGKTKGFTTEWVAKRIQEEDKETALSILKVWSHHSRECNAETVKELNQLMDKEILEELKRMEEPEMIRKLGNRELSTKIRLTTIDSSKTYYRTALIDSGCTSSCINRRFIIENRLETQKYPTCHDLAKWLSQYLYSFSFSFFFF